MRSARFPQAVHLFKFCHRVLSDARDGKINDQDIGAIIDFNPSDCSHWKKGDKSIRSIFLLEKLANELNVEASLLCDLASGAIGFDEAYAEHITAKSFRDTLQEATKKPDKMKDAAQRIDQLTKNLHSKMNLKVPPIYLPEVFRHLSFVRSQPFEMVDRLSRVLRGSPHQYTIQFKKGDLKAQTRLSVCLDLARIILEGERHQFPELGPVEKDWLLFERHRFTASLLVPRSFLEHEMSRLDPRKNVSSELASVFWVPRSLIYYQMHTMLLETETTTQLHRPRLEFQLEPKSL